MTSVDFLFWIFAILSVGGGVCMVFSKHPVSAAMFMIVSLVGVAALFVLLEAFFLAVLQVLVYAGAVMVLFLFIIMLLDVGPNASKQKITHLKTGMIGITGSLLLISTLILIVENGGGTSNFVHSELPMQATNSLEFSTNISAFGYGLMTKYMLPIQISGFMLLASMIGVIILSKRSSPHDDA